MARIGGNARGTSNRPALPCSDPLSALCAWMCSSAVEPWSDCLQLGPEVAGAIRGHCHEERPSSQLGGRVLASHHGVVRCSDAGGFKMAYGFCGVCGVCGVCGISNSSISTSNSGHSSSGQPQSVASATAAASSSSGQSSSPPQLQQQQQEQEEEDEEEQEEEEEHEEEQEDKQQEVNEGAMGGATLENHQATVASPAK